MFGDIKHTQVRVLKIAGCPQTRSFQFVGDSKPSGIGDKIGEINFTAQAPTQ